MILMFNISKVINIFMMENFDVDCVWIILFEMVN